jgi:phosphoglycerol transferase
MKEKLKSFLVSLVLLAPLSCSNNYAVNIDLTSKDITEAVLKNISGAEPRGRWTDGTPAVIKLNKALPKNCKITFYIDTAFASNVGQVISVNVGDFVQDFKTVQTKSVVDLYYKGIPDDTYMISINIPNPTSPKDLKLSNDERKLGILLSRVEITETK